ncbi:MAG: FliO/MopB family protein [Sphingomonas sp.]|uniref:flagellar biosynthetic protein FliO n=1 Tax=Sphingomonas sp. TaxID=28214 RepID=UPI001B2719E9|nr:flagellar biosynthetic protein FliO [Sphingomonas sp.]MBO9623719.1 FliO/MopB family protein [Sphingomonas sp.]
MDILSMLRTLGALGLVLGMLAGALWVVRRYDIKLPGRVSGTGRKRVELVERLSVDAKRSVALIRRDGCEHLVLIGPDGHAVLETGIQAPAKPAGAPAAEQATPLASVEADLAVLKSAFGKLVELPRTLQAAQAKFAAAKAQSEAEPAPALVAAPEPQAVKPLAKRVIKTPAPANDELPKAARRKSTRRPRDTARWNRAAVREALNG